MLSLGLQKMSGLTGRMKDKAYVCPRDLNLAPPLDYSPSSVFLTKLKIPDIRTLLQSRRLRWYGHVRRSSMFIKDVLELCLEVVPVEDQQKLG